MKIKRVVDIKGISASDVSHIKNYKWLKPEPPGEVSYAFLHDGSVLEFGPSNPPEWVISDVLGRGWNEKVNTDSSTFIIKSSIDGPYWEIKAKTPFEFAILLAVRGFRGKKRRELLSSILRSSYHLTTDDRNMLADYLDGKYDNKVGRQRKDQSAIQIVGPPISAERLAAAHVLATMEARRSWGEPVRNVRPKIIKDVSARLGADPEAVTELLRTRRGLYTRK
ncbi:MULTISPECIES: hypothetical protein [unclassified Brucella]|uniref:hypothetical protein n=1 Tax=unclassified Brucella TaxID=2632610 RepID=UPI0012EA1C24|nr:MULTISPECIES: hypothetical protein [unclassified Brucella]